MWVGKIIQWFENINRMLKNEAIIFLILFFGGDGVACLGR